MTYETVIGDLFARIPRLLQDGKKKIDAKKGELSSPPKVFRSVLIPALEEALSTANLGRILPITAFLEDVADASRNDVRLEELLRNEIGEWLGTAANEAYLAPWLGEETKRICGFVPGLAAQRRALRDGQQEREPRDGFSRFLDRFRKKYCG
jgi:hypothetical protein